MGDYDKRGEGTSDGLGDLAFGWVRQLHFERGASGCLSPGSWRYWMTMNCQ